MHKAWMYGHGRLPKRPVYNGCLLKTFQSITQKLSTWLLYNGAIFKVTSESDVKPCNI